MRGLDIASRIPTGVVHINDQTIGDEVVNPFGGVKSTGSSWIGGPEANINAFTVDAVGHDARRSARVPLLIPRHAHAGRHRRGRPGRAAALAPAAPARRGLGGARGPRPCLRRATGPRRRARAGQRRAAARGRARGSAGPRGADPPRHRDPLRRSRPPHRADRPDRPRDLRLRPAGSGEGPHRGPAGRRGRDRLRGAGRGAGGVHDRRADDPLPRGRRRAASCGAT